MMDYGENILKKCGVDVDNWTQEERNQWRRDYKRNTRWMMIKFNIWKLFHPLKRRKNESKIN